MVYYNNTHKLKVGIFDSGIGGLPVYYGLQQSLSQEGMDDQVSIKYLGDTKNFPYGTKTHKELNSIVTGNIRTLLHEGCSIIGIACNTASIVFNDTPIGEIHPYILPIVNISAKKAALLSNTGVHVISSNFTADNHAYRTLIARANKDIFVSESGEQTLIQAIEENDKSLAIKEIKRIADNISDATDTFVLGCTHFSHVKSIFEEMFESKNNKVSIVDPTDEMISTLMDNIRTKLNHVNQPAHSNIVFSGNEPAQIEIH